MTPRAGEGAIDRSVPEVLFVREHSGSIPPWFRR